MTGARRAALSAVVALALVRDTIGAPAALAAPNAAEREARRRFDEGEVSYRAGHYAEALAKYQAGYAAVPLPGFLVNIAQCQRRLGDLKTARATYREFVLVAPDSRLVPEVETLIKQLDDLIADLAAGGSGEAAAQSGEGAEIGEAPEPTCTPRIRRSASCARGHRAGGDSGARRRAGAVRHRDAAAALARALVDLGRRRGGGGRRRRGDGDRAVVAGDDDDSRRIAGDAQPLGRPTTMRFTLDRRTIALWLGARRDGGLPQLARCSRGGRAPPDRSSLAPGRPDARRAPRVRLRRHRRALERRANSRRRDRWSPRARRSSERSSFSPA